MAAASKDLSTPAPAAAAPHRPPLALKLRHGQLSDLPVIVSSIWRHRMNPLVTDTSRFLIAVAIGRQDHAHTGAPEAEDVAGMGQLRPLGRRSNGGQDWELASLITLPGYRRRGVASEVVRSLQRQVAPQDRVLLLCKDDTAPFYARFEFVEVGQGQSPAQDPIPSIIQLEQRLGGYLAPLLNPGMRLVIMAWHPPHQ